MGYGSPPARWGKAQWMGYPRMLEVRQRFDAPRVDDVAGTVAAELARIGVRGRIQRGATVAIGVGSRGITNLALVVRTLVGVLKEVGARPFVVPAMGSHGGATAEGQRAILAGYGITEDGIGAPIRASMETVDLGATDGVPIHFDRTAFEADHVAIVNRVKPHTNFAGEIESGLLKMTTIGLGKHTGAALYHRAIVDHGFDHVVRSAGQPILARGRIAFGLALVENGYDETALVEAVFFFFKQKTAYELGLGIPAEPLFRSLQERVLIRHHDYDQCFQSVQLLQWNSQVKFNVTVYRNLPTTRDSIMTS